MNDYNNEEEGKESGEIGFYEKIDKIWMRNGSLQEKTFRMSRSFNTKVEASVFKAFLKIYSIKELLKSFRHKRAWKKFLLKKELLIGLSIKKTFNELFLLKELSQSFSYLKFRE